MAITLLVSANTPNPNVIGDWNLQAAQLTACKQLLNCDSQILTEWKTTTVPEIAKGTYIQHLGAIYIVDTANFPIAAGALAGNGPYFIKITTSGVTLTVEWENTLAAYTWDAENNGLYNGTAQILPYAITYTVAPTYNKFKILNLGSAYRVLYNNAGSLTVEGDLYTLGDENVTGNMDVGGDANIAGAINPGTVTRSTQVMTSGSDYVLPRGIYILYVVYSANGNLETQFYNGSAWITSGSVAIKNSGSGFSTFIISDGSNTRIHSNNPASSTLFLHKY